jgi:universal stress protein A
MFRRILVGTDFSPGSQRAFRVAVELARRGRSRLLIVHVVPNLAIADVEGRLVPRIRNEMETAARRSAAKRIETLVSRARKSSVRAEGVVLSGAAHEAIRRTATRERADLVVVGTHGRSGLERALLGSVAAKVIGTAPCPVLTVRSRRR